MFIRMMICIVVIAIAAPFFIPGPNGTPIMTLDMFKFDKPSVSIPDLNLGGISNEATPDQTLYRYQDENGNWHFTDQIPTDGIAEEIEVSNINLMEAPPPRPEVIEEEPTISANPLTAVSRGAEVMEDAQAVQDMLDARVEDMDQSLNDIR